MTLLDARQLVVKKIDELKNRVKKLDKKPSLVIIRVGEDFASGKYVANKIKRCEEVGIESKIIHLDENVTQDTVQKTILDLNNDDNVTGVLLQLPIPKHLDEDYLTNLIKDEKDVDGFTIENMGKLSLGLDGNVACTPRGIITLLKEFNIDIEGQDVLIINRSNIVGKPLSQLFLKENATVTIAHSKTKNLKEKIKLNPKKDITILIPCLNEEKTIGICLKKAKQIIQQENLDAEILVVDNGCEDNSIKIAKKQGARVIKVDKKGYGNALRYGTIEAIRKICHNG